MGVQQSPWFHSFFMLVAVLVLCFPAGTKSDARDGDEVGFLLRILALHCISSYQSCLPFLSIWHLSRLAIPASMHTIHANMDGNSLPRGRIENQRHVQRQ
jgi:hypothetical protein